MSDASDAEKRPPEDGPWAIKLMPGRERQMALDAAKRAKLPMGEWLARAIRREVEAERAAENGTGYDVLAPARGDGRGIKTVDPLQPLSLDELGQAVEIAKAIAELSGKKPARHLLTAMRHVLAERLGAPVPAKGLTKSSTVP